MFLDIDLKDVEKLRVQLETARSRALPYAAREYCNSAAFQARTEWTKRAEANMTLRSQWTKRSIQVDKARSLNVDNMKATVGSVAAYMATQEDGTTVGKTGKHGVAIPAAAPGKRRGRKAKMASSNRLTAFTLAPRVSGSRQRGNAAAIAMAAAKGGGFVYLDLKRARGIYRVVGGKRGFRIRKVWDLTKGRVVIPRNPMLQQAIAEVQPMLPALAVKSLIFQLQRHKVLGF